MVLHLVFDELCYLYYVDLILLNYLFEAVFVREGEPHLPDSFYSAI